jgi:hypothetical protein
VVLIDEAQTLRCAGKSDAAIGKYRQVLETQGQLEEVRMACRNALERGRFESEAPVFARTWWRVSAVRALRVPAFRFTCCNLTT